MLPAAKYPANPFDGNEQTQPLLPEGGTDIANAADYNKVSTETKAHGDDLRSANTAAGQANHAAAHTDIETRLANPTVSTVDPDDGQADMAAGVRNFDLTMNQNVALTPANVPATGRVDLVLFLQQDAVGARTFTPPANTRWDGGTVPPFSVAANARDVLLFVTRDGGATWDGFAAGIGMA